MSDHKMEVRQNKEGRYYPICSCRRVPHSLHLMRWQADDVLQAHKAQVERARANLRRGSGTMKGEYEHAIKMAADPDLPIEERNQWLGLAMGYASRLGRDDVTEDALF